MTADNEPAVRPKISPARYRQIRESVDSIACRRVRSDERNGEHHDGRRMFPRWGMMALHGVVDMFRDVCLLCGRLTVGHAVEYASGARAGVGGACERRPERVGGAHSQRHHQTIVRCLDYFGREKWIHVASVIHPGETYTVLVSNGTRRAMGDVEKYARTDHTRIVCRWRSLFGWRPKVRLQVDEFTYPRGHRLTQAEKEFLGL